VGITGMFTGTIDGYAYQVSPNRAIITGQTSDGNEASSSVGAPAHVQPLLLGALASGWQGLSLWRSLKPADPNVETK
jgi:hypothetical protein